MFSLYRWLLPKSGWGRLVVLALAAAAITAMALVIFTVIHASALGEESSNLSGLVSEEGLRPGTITAIAMATIPLWLLISQLVRTGSAERDRMVSELYLGGASQGHVRRWAVLDAVVPTTLGSFAGVALYLGLRPLLAPSTEMLGPEIFDGEELEIWGPAWYGIIAPSVWPHPVEFVMVPLAVAFLAGGLSWWSARKCTAGLAVTAQPVPRRPALWPVALVVAGGLAFALAYETPIDILAFISAPLVALGVILSAPLITWTTGRLVERVATATPIKLAAARIAARPATSGRTAGAMAALGLAVGIAANYQSESADQWAHEAVSGYVNWVWVAFGIALVGVVGSVFASTVETIRDSRHSDAALAAMGMSQKSLALALTTQIALISLLPATVSSVIGTVGFGALFHMPIEWSVIALWFPLITVIAGLTYLSLARWHFRTISATTLRVE